MPDVPRKLPPFLHRETNRHGNPVWYFRRGKGRRIRIRGEFGSVEFWAAYEAAAKGARPQRREHSAADVKQSFVFKKREIPGRGSLWATVFHRTEWDASRQDPARQFGAKRVDRICELRLGADTLEVLVVRLDIAGCEYQFVEFV